MNAPAVKSDANSACLALFHAPRSGKNFEALDDTENLLPVMIETPLRELYSRLSEDLWRKENPFSEDVEKVHKILFHPYRTNSQREEALLLWSQRNQPCLFGRIACNQQRMHFCILSDDDFYKSDSDIAEKINSARIAWKQRSLSPHAQFSNPAHGFILLATSKKLAYASANQDLRDFSTKLLELWGVPSSQQQSGLVHTESLFLRDPDAANYFEFNFSVDFFLAQGDGRWWKDHRFPGGVAFTANSVGHMMRYREFYEKLPDQSDWVLQTAMLTIDAAADTPYGKATWLKPLIEGRPIAEGLKCPFSKPESLKSQLKDKDWTRYGGHLHTDHAIRDEFFWDEPDKVSDITATEYIEDFAYLYDPTQRDHLNFVKGRAVSEQDVFSQIGNPEDYVKIVGSRPRPQYRADAGSIEARGEAEVETLLREIRHWGA